MSNDKSVFRVTEGAIRPAPISLAAFSSLLALAAALGGPAFAQTGAGPAASAAPDAQNESGQIAEVIVTARRVEERLQDIPASVAAIKADQVAGMQGLSDVQRLVSGVTFQSLGPVPVVGIRGFGNRSQAGNPSKEGL